MPTRRQFRVTLLVVVLATPVKGLYKMWAHRTKAEPGVGPATTVADAVIVGS